MISFCLVSSRASSSSVVCFGDLVEFLEQTIAFVLAHVAVFDGLVKGFLGLATNVAHRDLAVFSLALGNLDVFLCDALRSAPAWSGE